MKLLVLYLCLCPSILLAANFKVANSIACVSEQSSILGKHRGTESSNQSEKAKSRFSEWLFAEAFGDGKSKLQFNWIPVGEKGLVSKLSPMKSHIIYLKFDPIRAIA